ncbi:HD domain-containing phosphohydrolase [Sulfurimonas sp. HSL3-7]|uniref:HD domain-containing phosphohydrolase n=1 Tax=Sulfonitrofixus jiaomeiensis TaxID=3131938 RepID=UPI0031F86947
MMTPNKITIIAAIVFLIFMTAYSACRDLSADKCRIDNARLVEDRLHPLIEINTIISKLQKERSLATIYTADPTESAASALADQHRDTAKAFDKVSKTVDLSNLHAQYARIQDNSAVDPAVPSQTFKAYTLLISQLMEQPQAPLLNTDNTEIRNSLIRYRLLKDIQESTARLQAKVGLFLASATAKEQHLHEIIAINSLHKHLLTKFQEYAPLSMQSPLDSIQKQPSVQQTFSVIQSITDNPLQKIPQTPFEWFQRSTSAVDYIHDMANRELKQIQATALQNREAAKNAMIRHTLFWAGTIAALFLILVISFKRSKALARGQQLLQNYQEAIDYSTIVSKADPKGIITYVNPAFCNISGYSPDELLHQPHNIVRHTDMPEEVFKKLWEDLKKGKKWNGIIKNLKKDGTAYWVDASISPIYDEKGRLIEYIAIRRDITDIILLNEEIKETQRELIYRMGEAVESRSKESGHHVQRVAHYSQLLAQLVGLNDEECEIIFAASTMHDIGKISTPDSILLKAGKLTEEEWTLMKAHTEVGYKILKGSNRPLLKVAATVAYEHHEHYDGNGYPRGIKGNAISIYGRIVAIADVFDALATDRIYKKAWPLDEIIAYLKVQSGKQFDPELIELFVNYLDQFIEIKNRFKDIHNDTREA